MNSGEVPCGSVTSAGCAVGFGCSLVASPTGLPPVYLRAIGGTGAQLCHPARPVLGSWVGVRRLLHHSLFLTAPRVVLPKILVLTLTPLCLPRAPGALRHRQHAGRRLHLLPRRVERPPPPPSSSVLCPCVLPPAPHPSSSPSPSLSVLCARVCSIQPPPSRLRFLFVCWCLPRACLGRLEHQDRGADIVLARSNGMQRTV